MSAKRLALIVVSGVAMMSCAENRSSFFIQQMQVPTDDCDVEADESGLHRTQGFLDVAFRDSYAVYPLMRNQLVSQGNTDNFVSETNGILVEGANVRIWRGGRAQGNPFYSFYQPAASYVHPDSVTASGFVAVPPQAISALLQFALGEDPEQLTVEDKLGYRDLITVGITMLGTTSGNEDVETPEFYFPVNLCYACLVYCPPPDEEGVVCGLGSEPEAAGCHLGQDNGVDCRWCASTALGLETCRSLCRGEI